MSISLSRLGQGHLCLQAMVPPVIQYQHTSPRLCFLAIESIAAHHISQQVQHEI